MILELLYQDRFKFSFEEDLFSKYCKRIKNISKQSGIKFTQKRLSKNKMLDEVNQKNVKSYIVILEETGDNLSTKQFKDLIFNTSSKKIIFLIGGTDGFNETILKKANMIVSLSKMTLTHSFAAIILSEQIYRSLTIKIGHPYHRQ